MFPEYRPGRLPLPDTSYQRRFCAQILIADVMAAYEGGFAIDNHDLAMVTEIELETVNEAARCKLARFAARSISASLSFRPRASSRTTKNCTITYSVARAIASKIAAKVCLPLINART